MRRTAAVALAVVVLAMVAPRAAVAGLTAEEQLLELLNGARADVGAPPLELAPDISVIARAWAEVLAETKHLHHNPHLATQLCCHTRFAENVAWGRVPSGWLERSVEGVHNALMESIPHRVNIHNPVFDQVGIGTVLADGVLWVVQDFRRHDGTASTSTQSDPVRSWVGPHVTDDQSASNGRPAAGAFASGNLMPDRAAAVLASIERTELHVASPDSGT